MRISDWSSDVCSSDLQGHQQTPGSRAQESTGRLADEEGGGGARDQEQQRQPPWRGQQHQRFDRRAGARTLDVPVPAYVVHAHVVEDQQAEGADANPVQVVAAGRRGLHGERSEEHTSELQSLMRISYAVFCLKKKNTK